MSAIDSYILTLVTFIPLAGALLLLIFPRRDRDIRVFSLVVLRCWRLWFPCICRRIFIALQSGFQFEVDHPWIPTPNIHYHIGVDGVSCGWSCSPRSSRRCAC